LLAIAAAFVLGITGIEAQQAFAEVIDFETGFVDLQAVGDVTTLTNTVTFEVGLCPDTKGTGFIAEEDGPPFTAYSPNDKVPDARDGSFFLTNQIGTPPITPFVSLGYCISFATPVNNFSLDLYDYHNGADGGANVGDTATLKALDANQALIDSDTFTILGVELDPNAVFLSVQSPSATISFVELSTSVRDIGTGIDNIKFNINGNGNGEPTHDIDINKCVTFDKGDIDIETGTGCDNIIEGNTGILLIANEGDTVFFRIDVEVITGEDPTGIKVKDLLPNGLVFVSSEKTGFAGTEDYVSATGVWDIGAIAEGGTRSLLIEATVKTGTCGTTLENTASLNAIDQVEGPTDNNVASVRVQVDPEPEEDCPIVEPSPPTPAGAHEPPTIGMNMGGNIQIVTNGMGIDGQFWTVTQFYHEEMKLMRLLTSPHTISNTIFCNEGVQECDYVGIAFTTKEFDFNDAVMKVEAKKTNGEWAISWYDPQDFIQDPDDDIPGEITFTADIEGNFLLTSINLRIKG